MTNKTPVYVLALILIFGYLIYTLAIKKVEKNYPKIKVDYTDIGLFYDVLESAKKQNQAITGKYMYENYVQKSSPGLKDGYAKIRQDVFPIDENGVVTNFDKYNKITSNIDFYIANKAIFLNQIILTKKDINILSRKMCAFLGEEFCHQFLVDKTVYYTISGLFNMGGTAFKDGIFVDVSMVYDDKLDYSRLSEKTQSIIKHFFTKEDAAFLVAHEFFHVFQILTNKNFFENYQNNSLKTRVLVEGGANFFASNIISQESNTHKQQREYLAKNPDKYIEFSKDLTKSFGLKKSESEKISSKWLHNINSKAVKKGKYPPDLGYYIGEKIVQTFFNEEVKNNNKKEVIENILTLQISDQRLKEILLKLSK